MVIVTPHYIICANAGDSQAMLVRLNHKNKRNNLVVLLSLDHKPNNAGEQRHITKASGFMFSGQLQDVLQVN